MKIAIVEDEILIREGLRRLIAKTAPQDEIVGEAGDGCAGLRLLLERRPDLVLADIRMPGMDGIQMLRAAQEAGFAPVIIFLSAYSDFSYAREAMKLGVSEYLLKPVRADELIAAINGARELVERRMLSHMGQRTLSDILSEALLGSAPLSEAVLTYVQRKLGWPTRDVLAVLLLHREDGDMESEWTRLSACLPGKHETVAYGEYLATVFADFGERERLAFAIESDVLVPLGRLISKPPLAMLAFADGFSKLHEVFSAEQSHFEYSLIAPAWKLMRYPELTQWPLRLLVYPIELETACRIALGNEDTQKLLSLVGGFGARLLGDQLHHPRDIKEAYMRFAMTLFSTGRELGKETGGGHELVGSIMDAHRIEDMDACLGKLAEGLCAGTAKPEAESLLVRKATGLMKEYYAQGITLEEIAQKLSVTPEYLGTKIHRELGCTFGTLMKRLRVEYAKNLLLTTDMKLYQIALAVGYMDPKYFSHVFKSVTGVLPMEFKAMNR